MKPITEASFYLPLVLNSDHGTNRIDTDLWKTSRYFSEARGHGSRIALGGLVRPLKYAAVYSLLSKLLSQSNTDGFLRLRCGTPAP